MMKKKRMMMCNRNVLVFACRPQTHPLSFIEFENHAQLFQTLTSVLSLSLSLSLIRTHIQYITRYINVTFLESIYKVATEWYILY